METHDTASCFRPLVTGSPKKTMMASPINLSMVPPCLCTILLISVRYSLSMAFSSDRESTRLNSSHVEISYAVFCLKKKKYNVYTLDGGDDGGYYTVKDCVTIDVLARRACSNVYVGCMGWCNFSASY